MTRKEELKEQEELFYKLQDKYNETKDKECWDKMFFMVHRAINASIKQKLKGVRRNDVDDLTMDATIKVMSRYQKPQGYNITNLLCAAHFAALDILYNKKQQQVDRELSYEGWQEYEYKRESM